MVNDCGALGQFQLTWNWASTFVNILLLLAKCQIPTIMGRSLQKLFIRLAVLVLMMKMPTDSLWLPGESIALTNSWKERVGWPKVFVKSSLEKGREGKQPLFCNFETKCIEKVSCLCLLSQQRILSLCLTWKHSALWTPGTMERVVALTSPVSE